MTEATSSVEVGSAPVIDNLSTTPVSAKNAPTGQASKSNEPAIDDPDIDLGDGLVFKKTQLADSIRRQKEIEAGSRKKFEEAARDRKEALEIKQQAAEFARYLKQNPLEALHELGVDVSGISQNLLNKAIERELMKPEERESADLKEQLAREREVRTRLEEERKQREEDSKKSAFEQEVQQYESMLVDKFSKAVENAGLPAEPEYIKWMADIVEAHLQENQPVNIDDIASGIKQKLINNSKSILGKFKDEELRDYLGEDNANRVRKLFLTQVKTPVINNPPSHRKTYNAPKSKMLGMADMQAIREKWGA